MSIVNTKEAIDTDWKVLVSATQKASSLDGLQQTRSRRNIKSYEQYLTETTSTQTKSQKSKDNNDKNNNKDIGFTDIEKQDDVYALGDWLSDDEVEIGSDESSQTGIKFKKYKFTAGYFLRRFEPIQEEDEECTTECNDCSSSDSTEKEHSKNLHVYSQDESIWESASSSEDDNSFDEFLKLSKCKPAPRKDDDAFFNQSMAYTSLTDCVFKKYYPEWGYNNKSYDGHKCQFVRRRKRGYDYQKEFTKNGNLPLEERLPLMQVLDALDDINKVLKMGKITPRMERILEYKQDYPFTEGYQEETLGWCPWLVYKVERLCKKLSAKQWPY